MDEYCLRVRRLLLELPERGSRGLLVHHWDSDGAASAALVLRRTGPEAWGRVEVPRIGAYSAAALPPVGDEGLVLVLDYGIPGEEYDAYAAHYNARLAAVDHHRVSPPSLLEDYCNPVSRGIGGEAEYPACSFLIGNLLYESPGRLELGLMALGIAGDLAPYIDSGRGHPGLELLRDLASRAGLSVGLLREAAEHVDASYRVLDTDCLRRAVYTLASEGVGGLLRLDCAVRNVERSERIVEDALSRLERVYGDNRLEVYRLAFDAYVTSALGRRLASEKPWKIVALSHRIPSMGVLFVYVRSIEHRLEQLRDTLRRQGLRVGGKDRVVVVEASPHEERRILEALIEAVVGRSA